MRRPVPGVHDAVAMYVRVAEHRRNNEIYRAIMKSKLQIMTRHNSRSLPRALCLIVALFAPVRPVACGCLFARACAQNHEL